MVQSCSNLLTQLRSDLKTMIPRWAIGEIIGTFLLIFFGCGAVASAVAFDAFQGVFQVAMVWGFGLIVAILLSADHSQAHFNPAITLPMFLFRGMNGRLALGYVMCQLIGAFLAAAILFLIFREPLAAHEQAQGIQRGQTGAKPLQWCSVNFFQILAGNP